MTKCFVAFLLGSINYRTFLLTNGQVVLDNSVIHNYPVLSFLVYEELTTTPVPPTPAVRGRLQGNSGRTGNDNEADNDCDDDDDGDDDDG